MTCATSTRSILKRFATGAPSSKRRQMSSLSKLSKCINEGNQARMAVRLKPVWPVSRLLLLRAQKQARLQRSVERRHSRTGKLQLTRSAAIRIRMLLSKCRACPSQALEPSPLKASTQPRVAAALPRTSAIQYQGVSLQGLADESPRVWRVLRYSRLLGISKEVYCRMS